MGLHFLVGKVTLQFLFAKVADNTPSDLQLPLRQWGTGNVYLLVLSKAKR